MRQPSSIPSPSILTRSALCLLALPLTAGSFNDGKYESNLGYSFTPPQGWIKYDASTALALASQLPENLRSVNFSHVDVVFYPPFGPNLPSLDEDRARTEALANGAESQPERSPIQAPSFSPSISVMVLYHSPSERNTELAKRLTTQLQNEIKDVANYASDFKVQKSTHDSKAGKDSFQYQMSFRYRSREIKLEQNLLIGSDFSILVSCTSDANEYLVPDWCSGTVSSFEY